MAHPLDGAFAKIGHAGKHLDELEAEIAATPYDIDAIRFASKFDADTSTVEVLLENVPELPARWGLIAADVIQNLRTAHNYLVWELARLNLAAVGERRDPDDRTQFPIAYKVWRGINQSQVADLRPEHRARIEAIQPNGANHFAQFPEALLRDAETPDELTNHHPLTHLAVLSNNDKHRVLLPVALVAGRTVIRDYEGINCVVNSINNFVQVKLENGAKWAEVQVTPDGRGEPEVKVDDSFEAVRITFGPLLTPVTALRPLQNSTRSFVSRFINEF